MTSTIAKGGGQMQDFNTRTYTRCDVDYVKQHFEIMNISIHAPLYGATLYSGNNAKLCIFQFTHLCKVRHNIKYIFCK